jgi:hypothetical protein
MQGLDILKRSALKITDSFLKMILTALRLENIGFIPKNDPDSTPP